MILNPSHEITYSGLPSDVLNAYVRYKKGSRAIVTWLVQFGPTSYTGARTLPIKELASLARKVSIHIKQLPEVIHFHFKETISARKCLSKYFRENRDEAADDMDTVNHEHFTNSLSEIYQNLCKQCQAANDKSLNGQNFNVTGATRNLPNHYDCLAVEDSISVEETVASLTAECVECKEEQRLWGPGEECDMDIAGDSVAIAIENRMLLDRAQDVFAALRHIWYLAGKGHISFISAAGVTNAAWSSLSQVVCELEARNDATSLRETHHQYCFGELIPDERSNTLCIGAKQHTLLHEIQSSEQAIKHFNNNHELLTAPSYSSNVQKPADHINLLDKSNTSGMTKLQITLLDNMFRLMSKPGECPHLVLSTTPCLAELGSLLSHADNEVYGLKSTLAIHLLATTYATILAASPKPSLVSMCRIKTLRLAQQASTSLAAVLADKHAFPCQCPQTLAFHLSNLEHDLDKVAKHKCWDLYFQSPWVSGTHIIEILDVLSYYGMRLFHYRHYVGAVLHVYNVVQQLGGLERISALDEISDIFAEVFFPAGGRPDSSFKNSWSRFVGARLTFKRGHKGHNHRESWCMAVPAHAARTSAGFGSGFKQDQIDPKFDYGRFDRLMKLKQTGYHVHNSVDNGDYLKHGLPKLRSLSSSSTITASSRSSSFSNNSMKLSSSSSITAPSSPTCSTASDTTGGINNNNDTNSIDNHPLVTLCHELENSIRSPNEHSTNPIKTTTTLNLVAIFTTCTEIIRKISDQVHKSSEEEGTSLNCICFSSTLLAAADRIVQGRKMGRLECWRKEERRLVDIVKSVMTEVMAGVEKDRKIWHWDI